MNDQIDATIWRILRASYLRLLSHGGRPLTEAEGNAALDPHWAAMEEDMAALRAVVEHAVGCSLDRVQEQLHSAPALDHEMVDESVEWAMSGDVST